MKIATQLLVSFDPGDVDAGPILVFADDEGGLVLKQDEDTVWLPFGDVETFIQAIREWAIEEKRSK